MKATDSFLDNLAKLIDKPPYLFFFFVSSTLMVTSVATNRFFKEAGVFFLYTVIGVMARHIIKDTSKHYLENKWKKLSALIYHLFNIALLALFIYMEIKI